MGRTLAEEAPAEADVVVGVPRLAHYLLQVAMLKKVAFLMKSDW